MFNEQQRNKYLQSHDHRECDSEMGVTTSPFLEKHLISKVT